MMQHESGAMTMSAHMLLADIGDELSPVRIGLSGCAIPARPGPQSDWHAATIPRPAGYILHDILRGLSGSREALL